MAKPSNNHAARMHLYNEGHCDAEIAKRLDEKRNTVSVWRRAQHLPCNIGPRTALRHTKEQSAARMLLYQLGWSDNHIGREQGVDPSSVRIWRRGRRLPSNFPQGGNERYHPRPTLSDVAVRVRRAVGRALPRDVAEDTVSDMVVAILDGSLALDRIEKEARRYGNSVLERFANRFVQRSIDETIAGTEDLRLIDTLVDDSSSSWLEEMGATVW